MTTDSRKSDCKFSTLGGQSVLVVDPSFTETMQHNIKKNNDVEGEYSTSVRKKYLFTKFQFKPVHSVENI